MFRKVHGRIISMIHTEKKDKTVQIVDSRERRMLTHTKGQ